MEKLEIDRTEEEKLELLKQSVKENWLMGVLIIFGVIAVVFGFEYYKKNTQQNYDNLATQVEAISADIASKNIDKAVANLDKIKAAGAKTSYVTVASLELAKYYFDAGKFDKAITEYDWLIKNTDDSSMKDMVSLRKAKALVSDKKVDVALNLLTDLQSNLTQSKSKAFLVDVYRYKGDIYMSQNKFDLAIQNYQSAIDQKTGAQLVNQKLNLAKIKLQQQQQK